MTVTYQAPIYNEPADPETGERRRMPGSNGEAFTPGGICKVDYQGVAKWEDGTCLVTLKDDNFTAPSDWTLVT